MGEKGNDTGDFYLYICSTDGGDLFRENQAHSFHCIIEDAINLKGKWEVAVTEYYYYSNERSARINSIPRPLYLLANFVKNSFTPVSNGPVLKRLYISEGTIHGSSINNPIYVPEYHDVSVTSLNLIKVYIVDTEFRRLQLPDGVLAVTLHFRQKQ